MGLKSSPKAACQRLAPHPLILLGGGRTCGKCLLVRSRAACSWIVSHYYKVSHFLYHVTLMLCSLTTDPKAMGETDYELEYQVPKKKKNWSIRNHDLKLTSPSYNWIIPGISSCKSLLIHDTSLKVRSVVKIPVWMGQGSLVPTSSWQLLMLR